MQGNNLQKIVSLFFIPSQSHHIYQFTRLLAKASISSLRKIAYHTFTTVNIHYMISKNKIKQICQLHNKKQRNEAGVFIAEGPKVVGDLLPYFKARTIIATKEWLDANNKILAEEVIEVTEDELKKVSLLQHPQNVLAILEQRKHTATIEVAETNLCLALDGVQDPGNLGTIIRVADWFGVNNIFCSKDTADVYNPKVIQATMGSIARINVVYCDLEKAFLSLPQSIPVYGTLLDGNDIYETELSSNGIIIMGNEGNGISNTIRQYINKRLLIPSFPKNATTAESLNVAIATAITLGEFRRR